ncbi:acyltransferase family protein [Aerococcus urinaeequi]
MYLIWYSLITTLSTGEITYYISQTLTLENIVQLLIFNNSPFASHLWYLNAYLYVLVIYYFIIKINISQKIYFLIPILLLTDLAFGTYSLVILGHEVNYIFVRNFLFVGLPYFLLGKLLRNNQLRMRIKVDKTLILLFTIFIFAGTTLIEKYILNQTGMAASREHYLSTTLLVVSIFILLVKNPNLFSGWLSYIGKKYSTGIYIIHFIIIDIYKQILAFLPISILYVLAPIIVFLISLSLIIFWHQFKKRFKSIFLSGKQNV